MSVRKTESESQRAELNVKCQVSWSEWWLKAILASDAIAWKQIQSATHWNRKIESRICLKLNRWINNLRTNYSWKSNESTMH